MTLQKWLMFQLITDCQMVVCDVAERLRIYSPKSISQLLFKLKIKLRRCNGYEPLITVDEAHVLYRHLSGCILAQTMVDKRSHPKL